MFYNTYKLKSTLYAKYVKNGNDTAISDDNTLNSEATIWKNNFVIYSWANSPNKSRTMEKTKKFQEQNHYILIIKIDILIQNISK